MTRARTLCLIALAGLWSLGWRGKAEYPCGEHIDYIVTDAKQTPAGERTGAFDRADLEAGRVEIDGDTLVIRYLGPDGQEVVLTYAHVEGGLDSDSE